ncbi:MAG: hypothetical protein COW27_01905 [Nitrosopumilales archaeon CG15_BIG_FIL_POST_REV_8_21_14_020_37_12]|nr:MAG: hypothetical protein COW27_01905 [Nitrosopumilales archaeon CG15_BIG_FIL_POST_REV_8_21_14_020_37_12]
MSQLLFLRRINIDINDRDYLDFLSVCIEDDLSVEEKLKNIIRYHVIIHRNKNKFRNHKLF